MRLTETATMENSKALREKAMHEYDAKPITSIQDEMEKGCTIGGEHGSQTMKVG